MKLLYDQNLSRRLVQRLESEFPESRHVADVGLDTATDRAVWEHARAHEFVIVSKDSDFRQLAFLNGAPPKIVWLRVGNVTTDQIVEHLRRAAGAIERFDATDDEALLVIEPTQPPAADV